MLYVGVTLTAFCFALCVIAVVWRGREQTDVTEADVRRAEPVREEDLVRPATDADGRPTWVTAGEIVWHEIVHWPASNPDAPDTAHERGRTA